MFWAFLLEQDGIPFYKICPFWFVFHHRQESCSFGLSKDCAQCMVHLCPARHLVGHNIKIYIEIVSFGFKDAFVWLELEWAVHVWCASTSRCFIFFIFFGIFQAYAIQNPISTIVQANLSRARNLQQAFNSLSPLVLGVLDVGCFSILVRGFYRW